MNKDIFDGDGNAKHDASNRSTQGDDDDSEGIPPPQLDPYQGATVEGVATLITPSPNDPTNIPLRTQPPNERRPSLDPNTLQ